MGTDKFNNDAFLDLFQEGDIEGVKRMLDQSPALLSQCGYKAHPLLREFVERNKGHCYQRSHLLIADLLIPENIRSFRTAVQSDQLSAVRTRIKEDAELVGAEFTAGRGIAQAIHHWTSPAIGQLLIESGSDIEAMTTRGETPLSMQQRFGTIEGVRVLLEHGANPNHGVSGFIPSSSMSEVIELLLTYGWDINRGQKILHDANHGHGARVVTWIEYGADPNVQDSDGRTALHLFAAKGTGREVIQKLVDAGADINALDGNGNSPLDLALMASGKAAAEELRALGAKKSVG